MASSAIGEEMIDSNVKGLLYVTRAVLPGMIERGRGHVINIGSIAGHETYPGGTCIARPSSPSKPCPNAMRLDLNRTPIRVSEVARAWSRPSSPRPIPWGRRTGRQGLPGFRPLGPDDIADAIVWCATRPLHVNVSEMVVMPTAQASTALVHRK